MAHLSADPGDLTDRQRWERVRAVFDLAADEPAPAWPAIVARESAGNEALEREVLRLLAALGADGLHLDTPQFEAAAGDEGADRVGTVVGPFRLVRLVGHGGMGTVYEGVRADGTYEQRVAIKFVRTVMAAGVMAVRFRRERQILAALEHPNIARMIDGGATERGEQYFVMEYVDGVPITTYADEHRLGIDDRLRLFLQACAAVEHAHGRFVVHRDLKPVNILVTADGSVKLLDFGVAKLLGAQDGGELITVTHAQAFTPEYASPEQLRDEPVSAASDVYSLGIVLYELLSGRRPFEVPSRSAVAALRATESEPPQPSSVATVVAATNCGLGGQPRLRHALAGELDNVVRKAIRADVARRYPSVEQLSADLRRYLDGFPVSAQPDGAAYRLRKFVGRNRAAVVAAVAVILAIVVGGWMAIAQARHAAAERNWDMAVNASANLDELGVMRLQARGDLAGSDSVLRSAVAHCGMPNPTPRAPLTCARSIYDLGVTLLWEGKLTESERMFRRALAIVRDAPGPLPEPTARVLTGLARVRDARGDMAGADSLFRQASVLFHEGNADRSSLRVEMLGWYAIALERQGRYAEADSLVRAQLALFSGDDAGIAWLHLGSIEQQAGRLDLAREAIARGRAIRGQEADGLYYVILTLIEARFDLADGRVAEATSQLRRTLAAASRQYPPSDPRLAEVQDALGEALVAGHRAGEAVPLLAAACATFRHRFGPGHPETLAADRHLETARHAAGR